MTTTEIKKYAQIRGKDRTKLGRDLGKKYGRGASIRELAGNLGRSYGFVHRLLLESGTELRPRGGNNRKAS